MQIYHVSKTKENVSACTNRNLYAPVAILMQVWLPELFLPFSPKNQLFGIKKLPRLPPFSGSMKFYTKFSPLLN
jgi:hypothetical protein